MAFTEEFTKDLLLYKEFISEREEILRHKWLESEKAGEDIGLNRALISWVVRFRSAWRKHNKEQTLK